MLPATHTHQGPCPPTKVEAGNRYTIFLSRAIVIKRLSLAEDLQGGVARDIEPLGQVCFSNGVYLRQGDWRRALAQLLSGLLILGGQFLAVSAPVRGSQFSGACTSGDTASQLSEVQEPNLCSQAAQIGS